MPGKTQKAQHGDDPVDLEVKCPAPRAENTQDAAAFCRSDGWGCYRTCRGDTSQTSATIHSADDSIERLTWQHTLGDPEQGN
jgi:hypothetical protein